VDQDRFQEAQQAYEAGDFRTAAKGFLAAAGRTPDGNGAAYHMAGNALIRLRRYQDAVTVYGHALRDELYEKRGAVWANLGMAFVELGEYAEAARAYENAIAEPDYTTQYKAYQGMAGALLERGSVEDAAVAYRKAALDPANPDPGKPLVNLGLCLMALGRPADAVEAYKAALGFDSYEGRGKALANLGQAYCALGEYDEAVRSFEKAVGLHGHRLSAAAAAAYETARANASPQISTLAEGAGTETAAVLAAAEPEHELVDGWLTGEVVSPDLPVAQPTGEWDTTEMFATGVSAPVGQVDAADNPHTPPDPAVVAAQVDIGDETAVADFFSVTEQELKERDREARRAERHQRGPGVIWRRIAVVTACVLLVIGGLAVAYAMGFGWPTQSQSVHGMLSSYENGAAVDGYWVAVPSKDVSKEMAKIPPIKDFTVDDVQRSANVSTAHVTVTPKSGAPLSYVITLSREGAGWKVSGVENDWHQPGG
jgi:tetratricopeptide (TPR) repeat protein